MNENDLRQLIASNSKPELAHASGASHVYQVWEDGEITMQKCGELLWQRTLRAVEPGRPKYAVSSALFPHQYGKDGKHGYIFSDEAGCRVVRRAILGRADELVNIETWETDARMVSKSADRAKERLIQEQNENGGFVHAETRDHWNTLFVNAQDAVRKMNELVDALDKAL